MTKSVLLVSPGAVDGYPPVQYQARLLADSGYSVTLLTSTLKASDNEAAFSYPGVKVCIVSSSGGRWARSIRFIWRLWRERYLLPRDSVEIDYDPIGIFYSDFTPRRPRRRIAHLHELLQRMDSYLESRLKMSVQNYDAVVVPDFERAKDTQQKLGIGSMPLVVENYPLRARAALAQPRRKKAHFEVIYCGSLGVRQKLDEVIRSIPAWPDRAELTLIGDCSTPTAEILKALVMELGLTKRVHFLGWMNTPDAECRLAQADLGIALLDTNYKQWRTALGASNKRYQLMKAGLPQIGDQNLGVPELLEGIGSCVQTHDPAEIAALVNMYAQDPERCSIEGAHAFERHQDTYYYEKVFTRLQGLINTL